MTIIHKASSIWLMMLFDDDRKEKFGGVKKETDVGASLNDP